jgi:hypothetical protein
MLIWHEKSSVQPEPAEGEWAPPVWDLNVSRLVDDAWTPPVTIDSRNDYFVNWADTPSIARAPSGELLATWLQKSGPGTYTYDIHAATSANNGTTWSHLGVIHDDAVQSEHGFVTMATEGDAIRLVWLDGRNMTGGGGHDAHGDGGSMTLRTALYRDGAIHESRELDDRTCECCSTDIAITDSGPIVVYRDRSRNETRDIAVVRATSDGWLTPATIWQDNWVIPACPVNGPAIDAIDDLVAIAWFTAGGGGNSVNAIFSDDKAASFGARHRIEVPADDLMPSGRVDILLEDDTAAIVTYQRDDRVEKNSQIVARRVTRDGIVGEPVVLATTSSSRITGFPKLIRVGPRLMLARTRLDQSASPPTTRIQTAFVEMP